MRVNCATCGTGSRWWVGGKCSICQGDPNVEGSGRPDWMDFYRAKFIARFGPTEPGDAELLERYLAGSEEDRRTLGFFAAARLGA